MSNFNPLLTPEGYTMSGHARGDRATFRVFQRARSAALATQALALLTSRRYRLRSLAEIAPRGRVRAMRSLGLGSVPIARIGGSESRSADFDIAFRPRQAHTWERWRAIALAWQRGDVLPPVELIQVGEIYYVRDGHHRISVARAFGQQEIDAIVTAWEVMRDEG